MSYVEKVVDLNQQLEDILKHQVSLVEEGKVICLLGEDGAFDGYDLGNAKSKVEEFLNEEDKEELYQDLPFATISSRNGEPKEYKVVAVMKSPSKEADYKFLIHSEEESIEFEVVEDYDLNISSYNLADIIDKII